MLFHSDDVMRLHLWQHLQLSSLVKLQGGRERLGNERRTEKKTDEWIRYVSFEGSYHRNMCFCFHTFLGGADSIQRLYLK